MIDVVTANLLVAQHAALVLIGLVAAFGAAIAAASSSPLRSVLGATLAMACGGAASTLAGASIVGVVLMMVAVVLAAVGVLVAGPSSRRPATPPSHRIEARDLAALSVGLVVVAAVVAAGIVGLGGTHAVAGHADRATDLATALAHQAMGPFELVGVIALVLVTGLIVAAHRLETGNNRGDHRHE